MPPPPLPPQRVRLLAVHDIHGEPDVAVVVDVPCFAALPRTLPHLYLPPPAEVKNNDDVPGDGDIPGENGDGHHVVGGLYTWNAVDP
jgi:hypothetical protein